jgi:phosphate:Na+ symporter
MLLTAATLLGGLGLFMLAVNMITDGLKLAGGETLQHVLQRYTSTALRGVGSGMLVTALVQSSSAVTVATIGFVNAGYLTLAQALGVVYGANLGTTMTGWLVAAVGFDFNIELLALPLIGAGMLMRMLGAARRLGALGQALAGFGLFFIGVDVLRDGFDGFAAQVDISAFAPGGALGALLYVAVGFVMTVLTQSSSAAIALTLSAAASGALGFEAAAATVIGANVGTTSTALLAVIDATANARRVAAGHVIFNVVTGLVALALLPVMLWLTGVAADLLDLDAPAALLALFHTTFNLLGVLLMWPFSHRLARLLQRRFVTPAEALATPAHLDRNVLITPTLAIEALRAELGRAAEQARGVVSATVNAAAPGTRNHQAQRHGLRGLLDAIEGFVTDLEASRLPEGVAASVPLVLRVANYLEDVASLADDVDRHRLDLDAIMRPPARDNVLGFQAAVLEHTSRCDPDAPGFDPGAAEQRYVALEQRWHEVKDVLLDAAGRGQIPARRLNGALEALRATLKMAEQLTKGCRRLAMLAR